jgi:ATP-dependent Lhr-like helicase
LVLTSTPAELLEALVTASSSLGAQYEPLRVPSHPLDVLCQQLIGMAAQQCWTAEEAFALVRRAFPYRDLARGDFDACLDYLAGRRGDGQPWLPARLRWEGNSFTIADEQTARILRRNIGSIVSEGTRAVLLQRSEVRGQKSEVGSQTTDLRPLTSDLWALGQVEEAFADRLEPGDRFLLDGRCLEYRGSDGSGLLVEEVVGRPVVPRWSGEGWPLSTELARRLFSFRVQAAEALRDGPRALGDWLRHAYGLGPRVIPLVVDHFQRQERLSEIPDEKTLLVEVVGGDGGIDYYFHTPLNRAGNDALARVVVFRLARDRGWGLFSLVADLGFALFSRAEREITPAEWRALLAAPGFKADLDRAVAGSDNLKERFRRVALTGLMLLQNPLGRRRRVGGQDWPQRRLFEVVQREEPDFILLRQAVREIRDQCSDAGAAGAYVGELPRRDLRCRRLGQVSPFAEGWTQAALGPSETVETPAEALQRLHAELVGGGR